MFGAPLSIDGVGGDRSASDVEISAELCRGDYDETSVGQMQVIACVLAPLYMELYASLLGQNTLLHACDFEIALRQARSKAASLIAGSLRSIDTCSIQQHVGQDESADTHDQCKAADFGTNPCEHGHQTRTAAGLCYEAGPCAGSESRSTGPKPRRTAACTQGLPRPPLIQSTATFCHRAMRPRDRVTEPTGAAVNWGHVTNRLCTPCAGLRQDPGGHGFQDLEISLNHTLPCAAPLPQRAFRFLDNPSSGQVLPLNLSQASGSLSLQCNCNFFYKRGVRQAAAPRTLHTRCTSPY